MNTIIKNRNLFLFLLISMVILMAHASFAQTSPKQSKLEKNATQSNIETSEYGKKIESYYYDLTRVMNDLKNDLTRVMNDLKNEVKETKNMLLEKVAQLNKEIINFSSIVGNLEGTLRVITAVLVTLLGSLVALLGGLLIYFIKAMKSRDREFATNVKETTTKLNELMIYQVIRNQPSDRSHRPRSLPDFQRTRFDGFPSSKVIKSEGKKILGN